ncbi:hypothetical protein AB0C12_12115 [Actinoplanes sp. NPDC048967]|uniref:hypothetical protein n=1 Tax=Actinoplanes sp. NPDC048967 TaxID=3155269 RepID=UPI0033F6D0C0
MSTTDSTVAVLTMAIPTGGYREDTGTAATTGKIGQIAQHHRPPLRGRQGGQGLDQREPLESGPVDGRLGR